MACLASELWGRCLQGWQVLTDTLICVLVVMELCGRQSSRCGRCLRLVGWLSRVSLVLVVDGGAPTVSGWLSRVSLVLVVDESGNSGVGPACGLVPAVAWAPRVAGLPLCRTVPHAQGAEI